MESTGRGASFPVNGQGTLIGKSPKSQIVLSQNGISWEHARITAENEALMLENLSASGTLLNGTRVQGKVRLHDGDEMTLTPEVVLRFETGQGEGRRRRQRWMLGLLAGVVVILLVALLGGGEKKVPPANWNRAYIEVSGWLEKQVESKQLPRQLGDLFAEAWRLDQAKDYPASQRIWLRLALSLESLEEKGKFIQSSQENPRALSRLLGTSEAGGADKAAEAPGAAAMEQFVRRRLRYAVRMIQNTPE